MAFRRLRKNCAHSQDHRQAQCDPAPPPSAPSVLRSVRTRVDLTTLRTIQASANERLLFAPAIFGCRILELESQSVWSNGNFR